jgi:hypothetical protein
LAAEATLIKIYLKNGSTAIKMMKMAMAINQREANKCHKELGLYSKRALIFKLPVSGFLKN